MKTSALTNDHSRYLLKTSILSLQQSKHTLPVAAVITVLNSQRLRYVLIGAHGDSGWRKESRATEDIDVVVMARHQRKAVRALLDAFPHLHEQDEQEMTRLHDLKRDVVVIDLMKPNRPLYYAVFDNSFAVQIENQTCRIPTVDMAVALKFAAMVSPTRPEYKKYLDASDFIRMLQVSEAIDLAKVAELGELVYPGGGTDLTQRIRQVRAGEKLRF